MCGNDCLKKKKRIEKCLILGITKGSRDDTWNLT